MKKYANKVILGFSFLMCVSFYTPIFASFLHASHKMNDSQITLLYACASLSIFLFEIPTGLLSDRIGERWALIIGSGLTALSTLIFIIGNVALLYFGEIIFGIGSTFFSGPFDVLLYKYCENAEDRPDYSEFVSRNYSIQWLALCASFLGCSLFSILGNLVIPFYATLFFNCLTVLLAFCLPKSERKTNQKVSSSLGLAFKEIGNNRELRNNCIMSASFTMLLVSGYQILQPYLANTGIEVAYNGVLYCSAALFASLGSRIFGRIQKISISVNMMLTYSLLIISCCFMCLSNTTEILLVFVVICCYRLIWGVTSPMFSYRINKSIDVDGYRDTVFSIISLTSNLLSSALLFVLGIANQSAKSNYVILCMVALLFSAISLIMNKFIIK